MDSLAWPKNGGDLTNRLIIQCNELVLILCGTYCRVRNINICTWRDVRSLYKCYHLYMARSQKSLQILPFVLGVKSEVSTNITIFTRRDVRGLYKYYHLYMARCQKSLQILPFVHGAMSDVSPNITHGKYSKTPARQ